MTRVSGPFVLLDDARPGGSSILYTGLRETVEYFKLKMAVA